MSEDRQRRIQSWIDLIQQSVEGPPAKLICRGLDGADPTTVPSGPALTDNHMDMPATSTGRKRAIEDGGSAEQRTTPRPIFPMRNRRNWQPKRPKSSSPKKTKSIFEQLLKPVNLQGFPIGARVLERLTDDVSPLYLQIYNATEKEAIISFELRDQMMKQHGA
ncbi:hypothetical protein BKA67DRAFT_533325 [Truncatella angustata]|uniref:Uncharacterized protein n=1 Tax=Truncatella angustata TaxID=152316 RepID=A0A9P8UTD7_9PEZI|nr:uncharacterized protein BKA67DRAFT_533325 [Truncatella angustata]KAH6658152.1 hypothetical protein BKA67DRAFT_533325 [Truncatella angustata]KAH8198262.1 hypothetical protein TruAng_007560 [Truncatella angustata]